jgi:hypothetical protein
MSVYSAPKQKPNIYTELRDVRLFLERMGMNDLANNVSRAAVMLSELEASVNQLNREIGDLHEYM